MSSITKIPELKRCGAAHYRIKPVIHTAIRVMKDHLNSNKEATQAER